jgi:hypothetical protein
MRNSNSNDDDDEEKEDNDDDEEEDQRLTDEEMERGLEIYNREDREQYRAFRQGKITGDHIISKMFVDIEQRHEDIKEEGKVKGLNKKQTRLLYAERSLEHFKDQLLAARAIYQQERNYQLTNPPPTNETDRLLAEERLKAAKKGIRTAKFCIKHMEKKMRDIEEGRSTKNKKRQKLPRGR